MRKLLFFAMGFCTACAIGAYVPDSLWILLPALLALALSVILLYRFRRIGWQRKLAFAAVGLAVGLLWFCIYGQVFLQPAKKADGKVRSITATALEYSHEAGYGSAVTAKVKLDGRAYRCMLYLNEPLSLSPGDVVRGAFSMRYTGSGGQKEGTYHSGSGIFLLASQREAVSLERGTGKELAHFPARLRKAILNRVDSLFPADTEAFAKALLLGDRTGLDYETKTALTASGIIHVVSVSGLHISILLSVIFLLLGRRRFLTPILGSAVLLLAASVTGYSASVVRSCLMNGLMLLALMWEREYDPLTAVAFALTVMLGCNPMAITSVGLQLSAASVIGIHLFALPVSDWIRRWNLWGEPKVGGILSKLRDGFSATVGVSTAATVATAPLTALYFGTVSLIGWLTNLLVLWIVNIVFVGILLCVMISTLWHSCGVWIAALLSVGIRVVLWVAKLLGGFPLAAVYMESPYIVAWLIFFYIMLTVFLLSKHKQRFQLCLWTVVTLVAAIAFSWLEPQTEEYRMTAVDVGQGQCILLQSDGRTYMVDCGGTYDEDTASRAAAILRSQGIFRLDGLILTHYDWDHAGAASYLLTQIPADKVYLPDGNERETWTLELNTKNVGSICPVDSNTLIRWADSQIQLFAFSGLDGSNESSTCVLFQKENCDILITGDQSQLGERVLLHQNDIPQVDVLVVGHHGARSSTGEFLLDKIRPAVAVISVGADNHYGHPHSELLERLETFDCQIRRTDLEGTIIIKR